MSLNTFSVVRADRPSPDFLLLPFGLCTSCFLPRRRRDTLTVSRGTGGVFSVGCGSVRLTESSAVVAQTVVGGTPAVPSVYVSHSCHLPFHLRFPGVPVRRLVATSHTVGEHCRWLCPGTCGGAVSTSWSRDPVSSRRPRERDPSHRSGTDLVYRRVLPSREGRSVGQGSPSVLVLTDYLYFRVEGFKTAKTSRQ